MRRLALVFLLAIFIPSIVLAWLALRSLRDQQVVIERQQALLYQSVSDSLSQSVNEYITAQQHEFQQQVESFLAEKGHTVSAFDSVLTTKWSVAEVGFVISPANRILSPSALRIATRQFLVENEKFLTNRETVTVFNTIAGKTGSSNSFPGQQFNPDDIQLNSNQQLTLNSLSKLSRTVKPQKKDDSSINVEESKLASTEAEFRQLCRDGNEGAFARFLQNKLNVMFWYRSSREPSLIFGAQLRLGSLIDGLSATIHDGKNVGNEICVALLDETGRPVKTSRPGFHANWKVPFVATEIGEVLPHWEIAVYLIDPQMLNRSVRALQWTLGGLVAALVIAIGAGGCLIAFDLKRELTLARQKTDFVSNVSHELKTPLTSIRMFSELLAEDRVTDESKRRSYLQIIAADAARLTRLINNVLDFSRMERGEKKYHFQECDISSVVRETLEAYRPHLEDHGFELSCDLPERPLLTRVDADALAQVLVNLVSNAEKYAKGSKAIYVEACQQEEQIEVRVLDRGPGVPAGYEVKVFEKFFRVNDALNSGVQGSGLGLTLARQIAQAHGGDVIYRSREGGGSCFTLQLPVSR